MYPYLVANSTISNVDKLKIIATVSSFPTNPAASHQHIWSPSVPSLLCQYICPIWGFTPLHVICVCYSSYYCLSHGNVLRRAYMQVRTFSRNIWACASLHACNISRNVHTHASAIIRARASAIIIDCTYVCLFLCTCFCEHPCTFPWKIRDRSGCSECLYVVLSNRKKTCWPCVYSVTASPVSLNVHPWVVHNFSFCSSLGQGTKGIDYK